MIRLFKPKPTIFITLEIDTIHKLFDYPKYLPIPRVDEIVIFDSKWGKVREVRHVTNGNMSEIRIVCSII